MFKLKQMPLAAVTLLSISGIGSAAEEQPATDMSDTMKSITQQCSKGSSTNTQCADISAMLKIIVQECSGDSSSGARCADMSRMMQRVQGVPRESDGEGSDTSGESDRAEDASSYTDHRHRRLRRR